MITEYICYISILSLTHPLFMFSLFSLFLIRRQCLFIHSYTERISFIFSIHLPLPPSHKWRIHQLCAERGGKEEDFSRVVLGGGGRLGRGKRGVMRGQEKGKERMMEREKASVWSRRSGSSFALRLTSVQEQEHMRVTVLELEGLWTWNDLLFTCVCVSKVYSQAWSDSHGGHWLLTEPRCVWRT